MHASLSVTGQRELSVRTNVSQILQTEKEGKPERTSRFQKMKLLSSSVQRSKLRPIKDMTSRQSHMTPP